MIGLVVFGVASLAAGQFALGGRYGVVFPRQLMLLVRALVNVESTASVVDPELTVAKLAHPLLPELRHSLPSAPSRSTLAAGTRLKEASDEMNGYGNRQLSVGRAGLIGSTTRAQRREEER